MPERRSFAELAAVPEPPLDGLALALAGEFRAVDEAGASAALDALGADVAQAAEPVRGSPTEEARACARVIGGERGFAGDRRHYDDPDNSMLDLVLARRRGLPILLSVVYVEAARRAGLELAGVGLPGHFVVAHFGATPPLLLDPFAGGGEFDGPAAARLVRPWGAHETAMRMLNNLVGAFARRGDLPAAIRAAALRLELPAAEPLRRSLEAELVALRAQLN